MRETSNSIGSVAFNESSKQVNLPVLKYGYRTEPLDWDEIVDILTVQKDIAKMSRSMEQQKMYEIFKRDLLKDWRSIYDHILCLNFGNMFEKRIDSETKLFYAFPPLTEFHMISAKALVRNDFPYYMKQGIEHWILWKLGYNLCDDDDIAQAKSDLIQKRNLTEFLHWVNPQNLKSLPEIDHVHILGRVSK